MRLLTRSKLSGSNILLLCICLVVIVSILLMNVLNTRNLTALRSSIDTLSKPNTTIGILHNTNQELLVAENKFRMYLSTGDSVYKDQFLSHLNHTITNLELVQHTEDSLEITQILSGLGKKIELADAISKLKHLADSVSTKLNTVKINSVFAEPIKVEKINTSILKKYYVHTTDTVKAVAQKKGFFKKLGSLFSNKDNTNYKYIKSDSTVTAEADSVNNEMEATLNNASLDIQKFYQGSINRELQLREKMNESEKDLAETNLSIIDQLNSALNVVLQKEEQKELSSNNTAILNAVNARNSIQNLSWVSFVIIMIIVVILIFNIRRTARYEKDILEARERAEKLALTKTRFLNNMSHEIRSPLTSIMGFTEQLESNEYDEEKKKYLNAIRSSSDHLLHTVNDVLDFSKLDAGKLMLEHAAFNIHNTIEEVIYSFSVNADKKGIQLNSNLQIEKEIRVMNADPKIFPDAQLINELSYDEVIEMAYYGAQVIHPKTIKPLQNKGIPLHVKCFTDPSAAGTIIHKKHNKNLPPIIVLKEQQALIHLESRDYSFVGEKPMAMLYEIFAQLRIKPNLIQTGAIHVQVCIDDYSDKVERLALAADTIFDVQVEKGLSLLSIRHYNETLVNKMLINKEVMLMQQTNETVQALFR